MKGRRRRSSPLSLCSPASGAPNLSTHDSLSCARFPRAGTLLSQKPFSESRSAGQDAARWRPGLSVQRLHDPHKLLEAASDQTAFRRVESGRRIARPGREVQLGAGAGEMDERASRRSRRGFRGCLLGAWGTPSSLRRPAREQSDEARKAEAARRVPNGRST
jgi:hypothetical protein